MEEIIDALKNNFEGKDDLRALLANSPCYGNNDPYPDAIANTVRDQGHRARLITLRLRPRPVRSNKEHREVLDAIKAGDWARARQMHYKHRIRTSETLTEILEQYQFPQL